MSFPSAGLFVTTLHEAETGPHPVLRLDCLAGFSPSRPRKSCRVESALIAPGELIFSIQIDCRRHIEPVNFSNLGEFPGKFQDTISCLCRPTKTSAKKKCAGQAAPHAREAERPRFPPRFMAGERSRVSERAIPRWEIANGAGRLGPEHFC